MKIAVIPARGGSKRIPRKNIKMFCGKPMISWSIETALQSGCFDRILVSTDDAEIAEVAQACGAEVPFLRPKELSDDHTATAPVIGHAIDWLEKKGGVVQLACCIYATAPFIQAEDLQEGLRLIQAGDWKFAFSATSFSYPIFRSIQKKDDGSVNMFFPEHFSKRSQDLPEAWHDAGQFYWGKPEAWQQALRIFDSWSTVVPLPRWRVQDIDTHEDWDRAELIFNSLLIKDKLL